MADIFSKDLKCDRCKETVNRLTLVDGPGPNAKWCCDPCVRILSGRPTSIDLGYMAP